MQKSSVYLPDSLKHALTDAARRTGRSEAEFIRSAIEAAIEQSERGAASQPRTSTNRIDGPELIGVGMGPGAADLVTPRALEAVGRADRVFAGSIGAEAIGRAEAIVRSAAGVVKVERLSIDISASTVSGDPEARKRSIRDAAMRLVEHLDHREVVVFLTLGDPSMFSIFPALADAVRQLRPLVPIQSVPGVMAFQELAARSHVVVGSENESVRIIAVGRDTADYDGRIADSLHRSDETLVLYRGGRGVPAIAAELEATGRSEGAVVGEMMGLPGERIASASEYSDGPASYLACLIAPPSRVQ